MRVAVMYDVEDIRIEERALPALEAGDILVRTGASGICSGDLMPWYVRRKAPFVFGHEPAGTVVALGPSAPFALGDRVFAHHHAPCFACDACRLGRYVHCATWRATALDPGGMAEYFRVPRANLSDTRLLPESVSFVDGSLVEPLGCVVKSLRRAFALDPPVRPGFALATAAGAAWAPAEPPLLFSPGRLRGSALYIIGAGVMGLMHVAVAAACGATVYVSDYHGARRDLALRLGAVAAFEPQAAAAELRSATAGRLADVVICGPGSPAALAHAVESACADGTVLMFTPVDPDDRFVFDQSAAYFRDVRLIASYSCGPADTAEALALITAGTVTAKRLEATLIPHGDVAQAYDAMRAARIAKAIATFA